MRLCCKLGTNMTSFRTTNLPESLVSFTVPIAVTGATYLLATVQVELYGRTS